LNNNSEGSYKKDRSKKSELAKERIKSRRQISGANNNLSYNDINKDRGESVGVESNDRGAVDSSKKNNNKQQIKQQPSDKGLNYRQAIKAEKRRQKKKGKKKNLSGASYQASKQILRGSWQSLIPTWLMSIFVIDAVAFAHVVFPDFFCSLGEEWGMPAVGTKKKKSSPTKHLMKIVEPMIVILINLIVIAAIAGTIIFIIIMAMATQPHLVALWGLVELWDLVKSAFGY